MEKYEFIMAYAERLSIINYEQIGCEAWLTDELSKLTEYACSGKEDEPERPCIIDPKDVTKTTYSAAGGDHNWVIKLLHNPTGITASVNYVKSETSQHKGLLSAWKQLEEKVACLNQSEKSKAKAESCSSDATNSQSVAGSTSTSTESTRGLRAKSFPTRYTTIPGGSGGSSCGVPTWKSPSYPSKAGTTERVQSGTILGLRREGS